MHHNASTHSIKGEDECIVDETRHLLLLGVADGHGGAAAARLCKARAAAALNGGRPTPAALTAAFAQLHAECRALPCCSGAALTLCVVDRASGAFTCANVGDAGCLLVTPTSHVWMSTSHRLQDSAAERDRVKEHVKFPTSDAGEAYGPPRLYPGGLACSRSVGDADCPHVVCTPAVSSGVVGPGDSLVLATDGLWDAVPTRRAAQLVRETRCASTLLRRASRSYDDDASAVVASWRPRRSSSSGSFSSLFLRSSSGSSLSSEDEPRTVLNVPCQDD